MRMDLLIVASCINVRVAFLDAQVTRVAFSVLDLAAMIKSNRMSFYEFLLFPFVSHLP
jgi:hypothetical protein